MKKENNPNISDQTDAQLPAAPERARQNDTTPKDEGEHFEIDILRLIKVKSRHVNSKVIMAILIVLGFVWLMTKGC